MRKNLSILLLAVGLGFFIFGSYLSHKAEQEETRVLQAESYEDGYRRPILGPVRRAARANSAESAQERIGDAKFKIGQSQTTANWLRGAGIVILLTGAVCFVLSYSRKK